MARKKTSPTRRCESCGTPYHPRRAVCPKCGAANPTAARRKVVKKAVKKKAAVKRRAKKSAAKQIDPLEAAIAFAQSVGGFDKAKAAIEQIEQIKEL